jgi:two-component system sensor histidine kinase UhpB
MKHTLNILLLEDDADDAFLIESFMDKSGLSFKSTIVGSRNEFISAIDHNKFDLIISDHYLPTFSSIEALRICNEKGIGTPFILVTGAVSDEYAATMLREGAVDYILKDRLQRLPSAIKMAVEQQRIRREKAAAETALVQSNERFELAAEASFDVIWDYDAIHKTFYCNDALEKNFGYRVKDIQDPLELLQHIHPEDLQQLKVSYDQLLEDEGTRWHRQFRVIKSNGTLAYVHSNVLILRDASNTIYRIIGVLQDVTEIIVLQKELSQEKLQRQQYITDTTIQAQEKEREEIGKELHDNVNQLLATAKIMIDAAMSNPAMQDELLRLSKDSIMSAIQEIRNISHSMMPPELEVDQFIEAIQNMAYKIGISGKCMVSVDLPQPAELRNVTEKIKLALYRIIQEQLTNILKYSKAKRALLDIQIKRNMVFLTIADNGVGFDPTVKPKGIGLKNMENRAELLEGRLRIQSRPGHGCTIRVRIPLVPSNEYVVTAE